MSNCITNEIWKDIADYEGLYQVSNLGRVKRIGSGSGATSGRIKTPSDHNAGYSSVALYKNNKERAFLIHRLVAHAFIGNIDGLDVNHINGDKRDNRLENLEIVTRKQNISHAIMTGLMIVGGEHNPQSKLTWDQVYAIRAKYIKGIYGYKKLSKEFGITPGAIRSVVKGRRWIE